MPTKGNPRHAFRFEPGLWDAFRDATEREGRPGAVIVRDLVRWWLRIPGAKLPERPARRTAGR